MKRRNFIKAAGGLLAALLPVGLLAKDKPKDAPYTHEQLMESGPIIACNNPNIAERKYEYFDGRLWEGKVMNVKRSDISGDFGTICYEDTYGRVNIK